MEEQFLTFVADVMEVNRDEISLDTVYNEFAQWDSMMMLNLVMELEDKYGKSIDMEKVSEVHTLSDLFDLVN